MSAVAVQHSEPALGIIAGGGSLPRVVMEACRAQNRPFFLLALEDTADNETFEDAGTAASWIRIGAIGKAIDLLRRNHVNEIVLAGKVTRPKISSLRPDLKGTKLLARIGSQLISGDNELLSGVVDFLEEEGFRVIGAEEVTRELLAPEGMIGSHYPDKKSQADIEVGARMARQIGALDLGQAVVVQNGRVLGVEAVEGTDALITRCAALKTEERGGVLVKVKKPQQETRVDLPTIGLDTIQRVADCGFAGIAVEAGASLVLNRKELARLADSLGIFVVGFSMLDE